MGRGTATEDDGDARGGAERTEENDGTAGVET
jgi:hypothetical protein